LIVDMMSIEVLDVTDKLGIPVFAFFPMNASVLAVSVQLVSSTRAEGQPAGFEEEGDTPQIFYGVPPLPPSHLSDKLLGNPGSEAKKVGLNMMRRIQETKGILANTFVSLEARAVKALGDPRWFPTMPPLYCVGPLVAGYSEATERHECLKWLDEQPDHSVVFLCFGSLGTGNHSEAQLKEIAAGLERSGHRFLWVVRAPSHDDLEKPSDPCADPDLDALLPEGFLGRTNSRGRCWCSPRNRHAHNSLEHSTGAQGDSNGDERPDRNDGLYVGDFISWTWQTKRNSMGATNRQESRRSHDLPLRP